MLKILFTKAKNMFWTSIFVISIAQGLFLISLILLKKSKNLPASLLIIAMLLIMVLTNFGYMVSRTPLIHTIPYFFLVPFGMIFLYGPLLYLYSKSILDSNFKWKSKYWLHFIPYIIQLSLNLPLYTAPLDFWERFNNEFLSGNLPIRPFEKIAYAIQVIHLFVYLVVIYLWINESKKKFGNAQFIISISARITWVKQLTFCLAVFLVTVFSLYLSVSAEWLLYAGYQLYLHIGYIVGYIFYRLQNDLKAGADHFRFYKKIQILQNI